MRALLEDLRQSPDIIAVLVLCLMLGVARQPLPPGWAAPPTGMRIHWTCDNPAQTALDAVEDALSQLDF
ncbi:MAG: hypothetical protein ABSE56_09005 [Bryobacteraceae bacterium]|jgi:hypothetical protein